MFGPLVLSTESYGDPGSIWRLNNTLQYKDGASVTITILNAEDNLANLANLTTARGNLRTFASKFFARSANYTATLSEAGTVYEADTTTGSFTITLPTASGNPNLIYTFRKTDSTANTLTIAASGAEVIEGTPTYVLSGHRELLTLVSLNGVWRILARVNGEVGTATAIAGAATLNSRIGRVTSESLTTAAGGTYTLTITNSVVTSSSAITATITGGTNTTGVPVLLRAVPGSGNIVVTIRNMDASAAFNGNLIVTYNILN